MAFTKKENQFNIGNVTIEIGQKYVLDHKPDGEANPALQSIGATKFPFTGSGVMDCINFDYTKNIYDTGFYDGSFCLSQYSAEERKALIPIYNKQIREPFEKFRNVDLNQSDKNEFWNGYRYEAYVNKEFDTSLPDQLFELFQVIIQGVACNKNEKNPFYRKPAQFTISNPQSTKNKKKEETKTRLNAISKFNVLADGDRDKLDLVLQYVGREVTNKVDTDDLKIIYYDYINAPKEGLDFAERFINTCEEYESTEGQLKMEFFHAVNQLFKLRKIRKDRRGYVTENGGVFLGLTMQAVAEFCLQTNSAQYKAIEELIEQNPEVRREVK